MPLNLTADVITSILLDNTELTATRSFLDKLLIEHTAKKVLADNASNSITVQLQQHETFKVSLLDRKDVTDTVQTDLSAQKIVIDARIARQVYLEELYTQSQQI